MQVDPGKNVKRIYCGNRCGWHRDYTDTVEWLNQLVDHPIYGQIIEADLVQLDIKGHNCLRNYEIVAKFRRYQRERESYTSGARKQTQDAAGGHR